jgi:hypothetical protein
MGNVVDAIKGVNCYSFVRTEDILRIIVRVG